MTVNERSVHGKFLTTVAGILVLLGLYLTSLYSYLLFHSLAEIFGVIVACGIFMIAWNSRRFIDNSYLLFIGIAYLYIAGLDLLYTLAYTGMGVFQGYNTDLPTQLGVAARYVESLSLLIAPFLLGRKLKISFVFLGYTLAFILLLGSIFYWHIFPVCFVEGVGLVPFKKVSEYIITLILCAAIGMLFKKRAEFDPKVYSLLAASIFVTIGSELSFTLYSEAYDLPNLIGHYLKILSFYLLYKAIIETGLLKPYNLLFRDLKQSEEALRLARDELERRVEERTAELFRANRQLEREIEERKQAEKSYQAVGELIPFGVWVSDPKGGINYLSDSFLDMVGMTLEECKGFNWTKRLRPESAEQTLSDWKSCVETGRFWDDEYEILGKDGEYHTILSRGVPTRDENGCITSWVGINLDITYRKRSEETLRDSEEKFRLLAETIQDVFWMSTPGFEKMIYVSPAYEKIWGRTQESLYEFPKSFLQAVHPHDRDRAFAELEKHARGEWNIEYRIIRPDGSIRWIQDRGFQIRDDQGNLVRMCGVATDVTERRRVEEALKDAKTLLEKTFEALDEVVFVVDPTDRMIIACNPAMERVFGYSEKEVLGRNTEFLHVDRGMYQKFGQDLFPALDKNGIYRGEFQLKRKDGAIFLTEHSVTQIVDGSGRRTALVSVVRDITERKRSELTLQESEKQLRLLSTQLLSAHEEERKLIAQEIHDSIGSILTAIKMGLTQKCDQTGHAEGGSGILLEDIVNMVQTVIEECRRIQMDLRPSMLDDLGIMPTINWFCREYEKVYSSVRIEKEISLQENEIPEPLKIVLFRITQEALTNIAKHSQADLVRLRIDRSNGQIQLTIEDNGIGFDVNALVSEPSRRGMGLTSMTERTRLSGGIFRIESLTGTGTIIRASWPCPQD